MRYVDHLVEEALEEEFDSESAFEMDPNLPALGHALGQVWRDLPPALKSYLKSEAMRLLRQLREDPKGVLWRIVGLAGLLMARRRLPPSAAVRSAVSHVLRRRHKSRQRKQRRRIAPPGATRRRPPPPRPMMKSRWQRGRRGNRFEEWI